MQQLGEIAAVVQGSLAEQLGMGPGAILKQVNGQPVADILDFRLAMADEEVEVQWLNTDGQMRSDQVTKAYGQDLGIVFASPTIDRLKLCQNNCQFCFVRQQPTGLRSTLTLRDDDYRLSALQGSFITLTNLAESEWQRILDLRLSPLYISVHTTNGPLRERLLQNPAAGRIMHQLRELHQRQIEVHCQIVLVPGLNDGPELERTINDLAGFWPTVQSVAVVPVGLTAHRSRLPELCTPNAGEARQVIDYLMPESRRFRRQSGVSWAYLADEWFVLAGSLVPERSYYDDLPQIENGVGLVRLLLDQATKTLRAAPARLAKPRRVIWVTGYSAANTLRRIAERLNRIEQLWVDVLPIKNQLFGESVTVAGLVAGRDIIATLHQEQIDDAVILVPDVMLRPLEQDFLDDVSWDELLSSFPNARIRLTPTDGQSLVRYTLGEEVDLCQ